MNETKLPPIEAFYSSLALTTIDIEVYQNISRLWDVFQLKNIGELSDIYMEIDILLLVCCFESFRKTMQKNYNLDPTHYITLPSLTWDAMLKITKIKLDVIKDIEMCNFIEEGIRSGYCAVSKKMVIANNRFLETWDPSKPSVYIFYGDVTNLYGGIMEKIAIYKI